MKRMDSLHEVIFLCRARGKAHESHDPGELLLGGEVGERGLGVARFKPPSRIDSVKGGRVGDLIAGASFREVAIEQLRFLAPLPLSALSNVKTPS